jgi:hypothetical protein
VEILIALGLALIAGGVALLFVLPVRGIAAAT